MPVIDRISLKNTTYEINDSGARTNKVDNSVIAPVEAETTASQAYSIGDHFIHNGAYCTVIAAISSGDTLTANANYVAGNITSMFDYMEQTVTLSTSADTTVTFTDARFTTNSVIEIGVSE